MSTHDHDSNSQILRQRPARRSGRARVTTLLLGVALTSGASLAAQGGDEKAMQILDRMEKVAQGESEIEGAVTVVARGRCRLELSAGPGRGEPLEGDYVEMLSADGRARGHGQYGKNMSFEYGHDGKVLWEMDPAEGLRILPESQRLDRERTFLLKAGVSWRRLYASARLAEERPDSYAIALSPKKGSPETWWISKRRHELTRIDMKWGDQRISVEFSEFRRHRNGLLVPGSYKVKLGFATITYTVESIEFGSEIEAARFVLPAKVREALAAKEREAKALAKKGGGVFKIETLSKRATATIRMKIPAADMGKTLSVLLPEVVSAVIAQKAFPVGPPFARFHSYTREEIDLEAGFPVSRAIEVAGRVQPNHLPDARCVVTWHVGNYHGLAQTYAKIEAWMRAEGYEKAGASWEVYVTDPGKVKDPAKWRTRVIYPVREIRGRESESSKDAARKRDESPDK